MAFIQITPSLRIDDSLLEEVFVTSSGPGGQNVNKVATAVQLRFKLSEDRLLPFDVKMRLRRIAGQRLTSDGDILLKAQQYRTRERNREDAINRLKAMIDQASIRPQTRRPTRPTRASQERRVNTKVKRGRIKALRRTNDD